MASDYNTMSRTHPARLLALPNELLLEVAAHLDNSDIFHLMQTNRRLYNLFFSSLYKAPALHNVAHVIATSNLLAFTRFITHGGGTLIANYTFSGYHILPYLTRETSWATLDMAAALFAAKLIDPSCWNYCGYGKRYTTRSRDFAALLRRNGVVSLSRNEAKEKWKMHKRHASRYGMDWIWMLFMQRSVSGT
jgi:hypothetical protein